jgi:hypothetical protein
VMLGSRVLGWIVGVDGELVDGELDIDVHGGGWRGHRFSWKSPRS